MRYDTILFDADNTLLDFTRAEHDALAECLAARGLPHDDAAIARYAAINDGWWKKLERGETTREQLDVGRFADFLTDMGLTWDAAELGRAYMDTLATKSYLLDGAEALCRRLSGHCRLYLITNGTAYIQHGRWDHTPLAPLFEAVFISEEVGADKPSRAYFDTVIAAIPDFTPARTLVVGDSLTSDIRGGIHAGLDTCWYNPHGKPVPPDTAVTFNCPTLAEIGDIILA